MLPGAPRGSFSSSGLKVFSRAASQQRPGKETERTVEVIFIIFHNTDDNSNNYNNSNTCFNALPFSLRSRVCLTVEVQHLGFASNRVAGVVGICSEMMFEDRYHYERGYRSNCFTNFCIAAPLLLCWRRLLLLLFVSLLHLLL